MLSIAVMLLAATYDVGPFPKPNPERAYHELKQLDSSGSPLRRAREDWEGARKRAADPAWSSWVQKRRAELDEWMANRRDRVEWVAGWWHDFVSPKDGSFLTWTPDEPGEETLSSPSDPKVKLTPKLHGGWVYVFRSRHIDNVLEATRMWKLTGERKYFDWAAGQLDFYAENWAKWPIQTEKSKARLMHQSLDDATALVRLVNAARLLDVSSERKTKWIDGIIRPQAELLDETMQRIHNIACWQRSAMALAAVYAGDDALWKRAVDGPYGIRKQIEHGITSEYLWFEQSLGYNSYVVSALLPFFTVASLEGRSAGLEAEMHATENIMLAPIYLRFGTGQLPNPADTTGGLKKAPDPALLASAYRLFPTTLGLARAAELRNWDTLIDPPEQPARPPQIPLAPARDWSSSRMAVLRGGPWQVFVHYGQLHRSHAQAEALNFEAFNEDTDVTHDPGTVGYGSPLHSGFYRTGLAHNVVLFDRQGQEGWDPGEMVKYAPDRAVVRQPRYRKDAGVLRDLRIQGGRLIDLVTAESTGSAKTVGLILHLQGRIEVPDDSQPADALPFWKETHMASYRNSTSFRVRFGERDLRVSVAVPGEFTIVFGRSPDAPPDLRDSVYIETAGPRAQFTTTLEAVAP